MAQPVATFLRHSLMLKTAMAQCAETPEPKPVHRLRSTTRRIEAILVLLIATADLPDLPSKAKSLSKSLRKIRRAAGEVRDLDVHLEMLRAYEAQPDSIELEKNLSSAREQAIQKLQNRLRKDADNLHQALDQVETTLAPGVNLNLSGARLVDTARHWIANATHNLDPHRDDQLHTVRKACKTGRYIVEIASDSSKAAAALAARLNNIQQTTGAWHDCLLLLSEAQASCPKGSPLTAKIQENTKRLRKRAESLARRLLATQPA